MSGDRILLVEDDKEIREGVEIFLKSQGYEVFQAADGLEGLEILKNQPIDLAIVDVMMPRMDGITMVARLRESFDFPVLFLSAKSEEVDKILGLNMGADDYITKPFSLSVLRARVAVQLRRGKAVSAAVLTTGPFRFDFDRMEFYRDGRAVELSKTEQKLLRVLVENRGHTVSRSVLVDRVWTDGAEYVEENALSVTVKRLRAKLEAEPAKPQYLRTVYGIGYTWTADETAGSGVRAAADERQAGGSRRPDGLE